MKESNNNEEYSTDVGFDIVEHIEHVTLENNINSYLDPEWYDVQSFLHIMFDDEDEFIILSLKEAVNGIRYMQACRIPEGITLELGVERDNKTYLISNTYDEEKTEHIFKKFYETGIVDEVEGYNPVKFVKNDN